MGLLDEWMDVMAILEQLFIDPLIHQSTNPRLPWPLESELRRHLLGFSQACRLTTPSSEFVISAGQRELSASRCHR